LSLRRAVVVPLFVVLAVVSMTASASAASVASRSGGTITITGDAGPNTIKFASECCYYSAKVTDSSGITAAGECTQDSATQVDCGSTRPNPAVVVTLGDGNDSFSANDLFEVTSYTVDGGPGDDHITGSSSPDVLHGNEGNDTVEGTGGDDMVYGDEGNDVVNGGTHRDFVSGGPGRDQIEGDGSLYNYNDGGTDTIDARDGEIDQVTCGAGADSVTADSNDVIEGGGECESVDTAGGSTGGGGGGGGGGPAALEVAMAAKSSGKISKLLGAGFKFQVAFSADCTATLKLVVARADARRLKLGSGATTVMSQTTPVTAGTFEGTAKPASRFRSKMKKAKRFTTTLLLSCNDGTTVANATKKVVFTK
jgi:hypothetical protein